MSAFGMDRGLERIADVSGRGSDLVTLWRDVAEIVTPLVPNLTGPCCFTLDPASVLMTSHFNPALYYELPEEMLRGEYLVDDVHDMASVARSPSGVSTIHAAAGGDPSASPRWQGNMALGGDQELLVSLRTRSGATWGTLGLYRGPGEEQFSADEIEFLRVAAPALAEGVRRSLLIGEARDPDVPEAPGLLVLTQKLEIESATPGTERWLSELPGGSYGGRLPAAVASVAERALRTALGREPPGEVAIARVLSESGTWVVLHGATLVGDGKHRVAVIVEPAHPARIMPLLMAALWTDRARAGGHAARPASGVDQRDRRAPGGLAPHRAGAPQEHLREDRRAHGATSSARCSSRTTSHDCATTRSACSRSVRCAADRSDARNRDARAGQTRN